MKHLGGKPNWKTKMVVVTAVGMRHMETHGIVKTQTAPHMQALVGHPSLATGSDEAVPV